MSAIHKQRFGIIVQDMLHISPEKTPEEVKHLMNRYDELVKHLKALRKLLKKQKETMRKYNESRVQVVRHLAVMSATSPIASHVQGDDEECGYKAIHNSLKASTTEWEEKFDEEILDRVLAWETAVSERVNSAEKLCNALRRDLTHYEAKVESLHADIARAVEKEKEISPSKQARSDRNDEKLIEAREDYETNIRAFELYLERVVNSGWRDLVPIVHHLATWDVQTSEDQASLLASVSEVLRGLKEVGDENGFDPSTDCIEALKEDTPETLIRLNNMEADFAASSEGSVYLEDQVDTNDSENVSDEDDDDDDDEEDANKEVKGRTESV